MYCFLFTDVYVYVCYVSVLMNVIYAQPLQQATGFIAKKNIFIYFGENNNFGANTI